MEPIHTTYNYPFLRGGNMGELARTYDWSLSSIGTPDQWPQSLRITLAILFNAPFPMSLFWGDERLFFYNDAYQPILTKDQHPNAFGKPGADAMARTWVLVKVLIDQVLSTGIASSRQHQPTQTIRNEKADVLYQTYSYAPVYDETGRSVGVMVTVVDTADRITEVDQLTESTDALHFALEATELGTWDLNPATGRFIANDRLKEWFGLLPEEEVKLGRALQAIAERDRERVAEEIKHSLRYASGGTYAIEYTIVHPVSGQERIVRAKGKARFDNNQIAYRFNGTLQDITNERQAQADKDIAQQLAELATESAEVGLFRVNLTTGDLNHSPTFAYIFTGDVNAKIRTREQVISRIHPDDEPLRLATIDLATETSELSYEPRVVWDDGSVHRIHVKGKSLLNAHQEIILSGVVRDVTEQGKQAHALLESEIKFRSLIEQAPVATCLFVGRKLIVEVANQPMLSFWGKDQSIIGMPLAEAVPILKGQPFLTILDDIFTTGEVFEAKEARAGLEVNGVVSTHYFNYTYKPLFDANGEVFAIMNMAVDVTEQVLARQELEESELFSRDVIDHSPVAKVVLLGQDLRIKTVNQNMLAMLGLDTSIIGQPFADAIPALRVTPILKQLHQVINTGETYYLSEEKIVSIRHGHPYTGYYNYICKALRNTTGEIYGVIMTATEVTNQVTARQKVEEAEATLRGAIELAKLGTWQIDLDTRTLDYSPRLRRWCGIGVDERITVERAYQSIHQADHERVRTAITEAIAPGSNGVYDVEYTLDATQAGKERILRAQGLAFFNEEGKAYKITGTAQDVTVQRKTQLALEQQVQERTEELKSANEELAATNDELATANNDLAGSNHDLQRSNESLQQFAYIASHDLQEPLRKIQSFGDILKVQYSHQLGEGVDYLQRMQTAATRMSILIKDLLTFSRISTRQEITTLVALSQLIQSVLMDLDLTIQETGAIVEVDPLPTVMGNPSQLGQLFQNLVSNALKFHQPDVAPVIQIRVQTVAAKELPPAIKPSRSAMAFYRIDVIDNGIGFEQKYVDRIFQVFQRLHNKNQYAGTGIGLAICEKVAANHGGAISADSELEKGATFTVYLPC